MFEAVEMSGPTGPSVGEAARRDARKEFVMPVDGDVGLLREPLLDCEAAAELLSVRASWVRDAARMGHLPCLRVGRHLRFTRAMLEEWLAVQLAGVPVRAGGAGGGRPGVSRRRTGAVRRSSQAALLASLSETPKGKGMGGGSRG